MSRKTQKRSGKKKGNHFSNNSTTKGSIVLKKTRRRTIENAQKSHIVKIFIEMLNTIKLYHWKTKSFAQHKATDELYTKLNEHIDHFVEVLLGKDESRVRILERRIELLDAANILEFKDRIYEYRDFLRSMDVIFDKSRDSDILNIRDELLGDINQFLYLLTFDK